MTSNYKSLSLLFFLFVFGVNLSAHEGMWIPSTLAKLVIGDMQNAGLKLSAEEIYSINQSSLKDAIVHFGGGCTAEVISKEGLILTNHHCGYSQIQYHSSVENDYLTNGFWAKTRNDELPNPNLTATFVVRIDDVSQAMQKAADGLTGNDRRIALATKAAEIEQKAVEGTHYSAEIKPFFYGNAYYLIVTETYRDVRLVGAPPSSIGKFGGDTDNWEWPRHNADFSIFRIYAGPDNKPADYSEENVPYQPKHSLAIDMTGVEEGEFTMVFGFPGTTYQYLVSDAVDYIVNVQNPARIEMREASLGVIDAAMESSDKVRIQYAAKQSRISNAYKKWIGQNMGLQRYNAIEKKKKDEARFVKEARSRKGYEGIALIMDEFDVLYTENNKYELARDYLIEYFYYGPEVLRFSTNFTKLVDHYDSLKTAGTLNAELDRLRNSLDGFYKDFNASVDKAIFAVQSPIFTEKAPAILRSQTLSSAYENSGKNGVELANAIYGKSVFDDREKLEALLSKPGKKMVKSLMNDPIYLIAGELLGNYSQYVRDQYGAFKGTEEEMMSSYLKAKMELFPEEDYWPDANSTLRITFGKMEGSEPLDGMRYIPYTTLDGVVQKYIPGDKEFDLPEKLLELHAKKDYGRYATDGELRVCILGSNHTTGGNSGSPALNAEGQLVGLNFDRTWESTMSDIMFNEEICRNIMVDVRYILFIVDKFAGAGHLIEEMELVYEPTRKAQEDVKMEENLNPTK